MIDPIRKEKSRWSHIFHHTGARREYDFILLDWMPGLGMENDASTIFKVDSNLQREHILPNLAFPS